MVKIHSVLIICSFVSLSFMDSFISSFRNASFIHRFIDSTEPVSSLALCWHKYELALFSQSLQKAYPLAGKLESERCPRRF